MAGQESNDSEALRAARERRFELKSAVSAVEASAASPVGEAGWHEELAEMLERLGAALDHHVVEVEREGGLLEELARDAPRFRNRVVALGDEHPVLCRQVTELAARAAAHADPSELRTEVLDALVAIARHRQDGADLVYEAYMVDIGGG